MWIGLVSPAWAQNVVRGSSILIFPKVVADGTRDTLIEIANTAQILMHVACWYAAAGDNPGPDGPAFDMWLTARQPTQWKASTGRRIDPNDSCRAPEVFPGDCAEAGLDPGRIPSASGSGPFEGHLFCVEVDASGAPTSGNHLIGQATIVDLAHGEIATYRAEGFEGLDTNNGDGQLCLGGGQRPGCPTGAEYEGCPARFFLSHAAEGSSDPFDSTAFATSLALVSCSLDPDDRAAGSVTLVFIITNEFEESFSASTTISGSGRVALSEVSNIFERGQIGSDAVQTEIRPAGASSGFLLIGQAHASKGDPEGGELHVIHRLHRSGEREEGDVLIQLTEERGR